MPPFFFDTSGLVKRFNRETGSAWTINLLKPSSGNTIYIARITAVEAVSALTRRMRVGSLTGKQADKAMQRFERGLAGRYAFVEIRPGARALTLISADSDLNRAAQSENLAVDNPNNHP